MNKFTQSDLEVLQKLPFSVKLEKTKLRIKEYYEELDGNIYVSRSGGKDSDVLGDIVKKMYPDVQHIFIDTGLEYSSVRKRGELVSDNIIKPKMRFDEVITKYGYPIISKEISQIITECQIRKAKGMEYPKYRIDKLNGEFIAKDGSVSKYNISKWKFLLDAPFRISPRCCDVMKKRPAKKYEKLSKNFPMIGTLAEESALRKTKWFKVGCNSFDSKRPTSQPLSFWTEQDILYYIKEYNIEIAEVYGDIISTDEGKLITTGEQSSGCTFCFFGITRDKERLVRLREKEPKKYDYVMRGGKFDEHGMWIPHDGLGYKFIVDWLNEHGNLGIKY